MFHTVLIKFLKIKLEAKDDHKHTLSLEFTLS